MHAKLGIATAQENCPQVVVFTEGELDGMDVDSIVRGTTGGLLDVVVFVNEWIHRPNVEKSVQQCVEKVVHDKEDRNRHQDCFQCKVTLVKGPDNVVFVEAIPQQKV